MQLSQEQIDQIFQDPPEPRPGRRDESDAERPAPYDFRRPDRVPKEQLRAIHLMHDFLSRNLGSSLGAYLRAYVSVRLVSVEQLSFGEFLQDLPSPTCIASVSMAPLDGNAILEINSSVVLPMLDVLLGGSGEAGGSAARELTEIEQAIVEGILRIILHDLRETWAPAMEIDFRAEAIETQPQLMQILSNNEAIVAIGFEVTMGESRGMMNIAIPSLVVKMMGQRFEQQWSIRRRGRKSQDGDPIRQAVRPLPVRLESRVAGSRLKLRELLNLEVGDVVSLELPARKPTTVLVGGLPKYRAEVVGIGQKRGLRIESALFDREGQ